jgi:hypothetical protein
MKSMNRSVRNYTYWRTRKILQVIAGSRTTDTKYVQTRPWALSSASSLHQHNGHAIITPLLAKHSALFLPEDLHVLIQPHSWFDECLYMWMCICGAGAPIVKEIATSPRCSRPDAKYKKQGGYSRPVCSLSPQNFKKCYQWRKYHLITSRRDQFQWRRSNSFGHSMSRRC